ncbi:MAG: ABC transporter ATP-binding protein [Pseudomonadota bacterium]
MTRLLEVRDLRTVFQTEAGLLKAVDGISFGVDKGETLGIVGESGSGKSVTSLSLMGLVPKPGGHVAGGEIVFKGEDLLKYSPRQMRDIRGNRIAMIFQEPMTSLNPVLTIGRQLTESLKLHMKMTTTQARTRAAELLGLVGIPNPAQRLDDYPHRFSGGMRQRVMIAMALACDPELLIADEPTTALDVTIQAQILELIGKIKRELGTAVIMITHDLGVIAGVADRVAVMYAGKIVEEGATREIFANPRMPYTIGLLRSLPRLDERAGRKLTPIRGTPPDVMHLPAGCPFMPRCDYAKAGTCDRSAPALREVAPGHAAACHFEITLQTPVPARPASLDAHVAA